MAKDQNTLAEDAFANIYTMIMTGELPLAGIVNESALASKFEISRGPIREAIRRLQGLKLVSREPYLRARVVSLSEKDIVEIFQLRESVEGMACRLATQTMSDAALAEMAGALDRARAAESAGQPPDTPFDLHVMIAQACGNRRIEELLCKELYHLLRLYRKRSGDEPGRHQKAFDEHWQIIRAMRSRDADLAESLMRSHILRAMENLQMAEPPAVEAPDDVQGSAEGMAGAVPGTRRRASR